ncbi:hypothetical protein RN001_014436 [Aquatica leii]|uniref:C2H2-type domain-containing protein n=1 Tax=Aquatica leii TaxID=1421715 RepID=A0AAN7PPD3_9COLE|nr:hypothetical protein RN001_014436 [Aquatica leii]
MEPDSYENYEVLYNYRKRRQKRLWNCTKCSESFDTSRKLRTHRKIHRKKEDDVQYNYRHDKNRNVYVCYTCDLESSNKEVMEKHVLDHEEKHTCKICYETFVKPYEYSCHVYNHDPSKGFTCPFCKYTTNRRTAIMIHINTFHLRRSPFLQDNQKSAEVLYNKYKTKFGLQPCAVFLDNLVLTKSINKNSDSKILPGKSDSSPNDSLNLFGKLYKKPTYACTECEQQFDDGFKLKRHSILHKVKPDTFEKKQIYKCYICLKNFSDRSVLWGHMRSHSGKPDYLKCKICQKVFKENHALTSHKATCIKIADAASKSKLVINTPVLKYRCCICMKKFADIHEMREHKKFHSKPKKSMLGKSVESSVLKGTDQVDPQFKCCQQIFSSLNFLCIHMYQTFTVTDNFTCKPQYVCSVCNTTFSGRSEWKHHSVKMHSVAFEDCDELPTKHYCTVCTVKYDDVVEFLYHRLLVCKVSSLTEFFEKVSTDVIIPEVRSSEVKESAAPAVKEPTSNHINVSENQQPIDDSQQRFITIILNTAKASKPQSETLGKKPFVDNAETIILSDSEDETTKESKPKISVKNLGDLT